MRLWVKAVAGLTLGVALGLGIWPDVALAHGDVVEHALYHWSGPPQWITPVGALVSAALLLGLAQRWLVRWALKSEKRLFTWEWVAVALLAWLFLGYLQALLPGQQAPLTLGYLVLPLSLVTVWSFVLARFGGTIRMVLKRRGFLMLAIGASVVYAGFILWSSNLVAPPEPDEMPGPGSTAFLVPYQAYGPLAIWPNIEFWIPQLTLFGAVSIGTGLVVLSMASLMGVNVALMAWALTRQVAGYRNFAAAGGASLVALGTNFCCCCAPAIFPLLALFLGTATAASLAVWMVGSVSPFYNLSQVVTLALLVTGTALLVRRVHRSRPGPEQRAWNLPQAGRNLAPQGPGPSYL